MRYGEVIKDLRVNKMKQTQKAFAKGVNISQVYLSMIESNKVEPTIEIVTKISKHVNVLLPALYLSFISEDDIKPEKLEHFKVLFPIMEAIVKQYVH